LAEAEGLARRRLDVDDVLLLSVDVEPVVAGHLAGRIRLDPGVVANVGQHAVVDDLEARVVVHLTVLELIARAAGGFLWRWAGPVVVEEEPVLPADRTAG